MCSMPVVCVLLPRFELVVAVGRARGASAAPGRPGPRVGPGAAGGGGLGGGRGLRHPPGHAHGGGAGALPAAGARAARSRRGGRRLGARAGGAWRRPARWSSRAARGWPASRRAACGACTAARSTGCWSATRERCAGRASPRRAWAPARRASARSWPPPRGHARGARATSPAPTPWPPSASRCCATEQSCRRCPRSSSAWGSRRSAPSPRCRAPRWPIASAAAGLLAHDLAGGLDTPLLPRRPGEVLEEVLELEESSSGLQLERALGLLVDRLLARRERDGRTLRVVVLGAALVEGGTWRERVVFREPLSDAGRMRLVLAQRLALLPAPAETPAPVRGALRAAAPRRRGALRRLERPPPGAPARGHPPGAGRRRPRGRAAHPGRRPRLAGPRAPRRADALRGD